MRRNLVILVIVVAVVLLAWGASILGLYPWPGAGTIHLPWSLTDSYPEEEAFPTR